MTLSHNLHYVVHGMGAGSGEPLLPGERGREILLGDEIADNTWTPEMLKLWHPEKNGTLRPTDVTPGSKTKLWWRCSRGHDWKAPAYSVKAGTACPYCSGRNAIPGETDLATTHPQLRKLWSPRNRISPEEIPAGSHKTVWWICERGHEWEARVELVALGGAGCPYCTGKRAISGETDLATLRPDMLETWDFEKNQEIDPKKVLPSSHEKVWWKCSQGHSWQAMIFSRTREQAAGCPYCTGKKVLPGFNDLATRKPKVAEQWHQPLNGELRPEDVSPGSNWKVWWRCQEGHVWQAAIYSRTRDRASGCPVCAGKVKQQREQPYQTQKKATPRRTTDNRPRV